MLTHIGVLTLMPSATQADRRAIVEGLAALVGQIDGLRRVRTGLDLGLSHGTADIVFQLEFESQEAWRRYASHPAHKALIAERIVPVLESKTFAQVSTLTEASA